MEVEAIALVLSMFSAIPDPRASNARHRLVDVLAIALLAVLAGSDDYPGIVEFGRDRAEFLGTLLALPHGVPSVSTFRRVFARLEPAGLAEVLGRWSRELAKTCADKQIAFDGKALRRSFEHAWKKMGMLHLVTAWCVEDQLCLGQVAVDEKSNEITAVPVLLDLLDLNGATVTVDALNTQTAIAAQIVDGGGHYVMPVKENHPQLFDRLVRNLDDLVLERFQGVEHTATDDTEAGHGRIERRQVYATAEIEWLTAEQRAEWKGLQSVAVVLSTRKLDNGTIEKFRRYYITDLPPDAKRLGALIRNHWSIENGQHYCLDVGFDEDQSRVRADHGDENLGVIRRIALNLLKQDKSVKMGIANKRLKAARSVKYLVGLITGTTNAK
jgi:predicted transposase YbfD/YdcC